MPSTHTQSSFACAPAAPNLALPTELLLRILAFIDTFTCSERRKAFASLALVNKHFRALAEVFLYRHIPANLVFGVRRCDPVLESTFQLLGSRSDLASCVRTVELTIRAAEMRSWTGGMAKSRIPALPNLRTVVFKPGLHRIWDQRTSYKLVLIALASAALNSECLGFYDAQVGHFASSALNSFYDDTSITSALFNFFCQEARPRLAYPKLRTIKVAKRGWQSTEIRRLFVKDLKRKDVEVLLVGPEA